MRIVVCPLHEVEQAIHIQRPSHVVSLGSPGAEIIDLPPHLSRLVLSFHDIVEPSDGLLAVTTDQVVELLDFAATCPKDRTLLIHCWAGVSRSPAAAYAVACARSEPTAMLELAQRLRAVAPFVTPNRRLIALADAALGREGAMSEAVASIGRGEETATGRMFTLSPSKCDTSPHRA